MSSSEETAQHAYCVMRLFLISEVPVNGSDLVCLCIVDPDRVLWFVVAKQYLIIFEIDGLASNVVPKQLLY